MKDQLVNYLLHLADNALILAQRNSEWCGHGPVLEQDIAITNISLDLIGQARNFYQYAAEITGDGATEDSLAYLRTEREFKNILLVEQPNGDTNTKYQSTDKCPNKEGNLRTKGVEEDKRSEGQDKKRHHPGTCCKTGRKTDKASVRFL